MDKILFLLPLLAALALVLWNGYRTRRTMSRISKMLTQAQEGAFTEHTFDESRLSALETQFAHYLASSAVSEQNLSQEKAAIQSLIADISHQTKTPIANLLLYSELLQEEDLSPQAKSCAQILGFQAEKLQFLIDALVKLSRLENGIVKLSPRESPLQPMLEAARQQYAPAAQGKGLAFTVLDSPLTACFDPKWTLEALGNLLDNAIKYTPSGFVTVEAAAYELFLRIDVRDTGIGIPESQQGQIFSRFYRSPAVASQPGVGIGLHLARQIMASQGGYIKVCSQPGQGSTFSLFLPR